MNFKKKGLYIHFGCRFENQSTYSDFVKSFSLILPKFPQV